MNNGAQVNKIQGGREMPTPFECAQPRRVVFGRGRLREAGRIVREYGTRCIVCTGSRPERAAELLDSLRGAGLVCELLTVSGEPTFESIRQAAARAAEFSPDAVVAMGGGSVLDTGKALAMLATNGGDPLDYAEIVGAGKPIMKTSLPLLAIPATAGTGSEATRNAVLAHTEKQVKVSLRSRSMMPETVILDPHAMNGLPAHIIAASGMDALCQLIEAFVSCKANAWTDALCRAGIPMAFRALPKACDDPDDLGAREEMLLAACWSGVALANAGLGAVHGFAGVVGGLTGAPHGLICATLLAPVCRANIAALGPEGAHPALGKYAELAEMLTGRDAEPEEGTGELERLAARLPLRPFHVPEGTDGERVVAGAMAASSMKGNPVVLPKETLAALWRSVTKTS